MSLNRLIFLAILGLAAAAGCGSSNGDTARPMAALADSFRAQEAAREVEQLWLGATPTERLQLEPRIRKALLAHGSDPSATPLRHYLVWILLQRGDLAGGERLLSEKKRAKLGSHTDFGGVLSAGLLLRRGKAEQALRQLQTVHGSLIDLDQRTTCNQFLVEAAIATQHIETATAHAIDLLLHAAVLQQESARQQIQTWLDKAPSSDLEDAYTSLLRAKPREAVDRRKHAQIVNQLLAQTRRRLRELALKEQDAQLARRIIDHYVPDGNTEALTQLAATGNLPPRIVGRSVGLILELEPTLRSQRSAQVAVGLSSTLELHAPQAQGEGITLRTRSTTGDVESLRLAFAHLISDGAAVVIAGMSEESASTVVELAEQHRMPTLVLSEPDRLPRQRKWSFLLGVSALDVTTALREWATRQNLEPEVIAVDDPRCALQNAVVGGTAFPVGAWKQNGVRSVLHLGSDDCATRLISELNRAQHSPIVLFGLDTAHLQRTVDRAVTFSTGAFPRPAESPAQTWYSALGHDAARFSALATAELDSVMTNQPEEVELFHTKVAATLSEGRVTDLWTTTSGGFNATRRLERTLTARQGSAMPQGKPIQQGKAP